MCNNMCNKCQKSETLKMKNIENDGNVTINILIIWLYILASVNLFLSHTRFSK